MLFLLKAVAFCPWQPRTLATGGGSLDRNIRFWNLSTGNLINSIDTGSQVCCLFTIYFSLFTFLKILKKIFSWNYNYRSVPLSGALKIIKNWPVPMGILIIKLQFGNIQRWERYVLKIVIILWAQSFTSLIAELR